MDFNPVDGQKHLKDANCLADGEDLGRGGTAGRRSCLRRLGLAYAGDLTVHHHPSTVRDARARRRLTIRNNLWFVWLRRLIASALRHTVGLLRTFPRDIVSLVGLIEALQGLPWVLEKRRVVPSHVKRGLRALERSHYSTLSPMNQVYRQTGESQQP